MTILREETLTVEEIESMVYDVPDATRDEARVNNYYFTHFFRGEKISDLYKGIDLEYFVL